MEFPIYCMQTRVTYAETDAMGVVYYAHYLRWFEMGRTEYMRQLGIPYKEIESQGVYLPVAEVYCKYLDSPHYDDVLVIETQIDYIKRASMQFQYRIWRQEDKKELAQGRTLHAFVNKDGKIVKVPTILKSILHI